MCVLNIGPGYPFQGFQKSSFNCIENKMAFENPLGTIWNQTLSQFRKCAWKMNLFFQGFYKKLEQMCKI